MCFFYWLTSHATQDAVVLEALPPEIREEVGQGASSGYALYLSYPRYMIEWWEEQTASNSFRFFVRQLCIENLS